MRRLLLLVWIVLCIAVIGLVLLYIVLGALGSDVWWVFLIVLGAAVLGLVVGVKALAGNR